MRLSYDALVFQTYLQRKWAGAEPDSDNVLKAYKQRALSDFVFVNNRDYHATCKVRLHLEMISGLPGNEKGQ